MNSGPRVSVVTPFYNTREYLVECIESVLRQSYENYEYILVDNQSTDGSQEIAQEYAKRFPEKIRLIRTESFLSQVQNYNFALKQISAESMYCKMVQADDWIYPECLERMVGLAESDDQIGIVSSYRLKGGEVLGTGLPTHRTVFQGAEVCRMQLMSRKFVFGTPTTTLYRSEIVREAQAFFDESTMFDDTDACYRILEHWKFGFIHQVLSFTRVDNDSIMSRVKDFQYWHLDRLLQLHKFGGMYLQEKEYRKAYLKAKDDYYRFLADRWLKGSGSDFWRYHEDGLRTGGLNLERGTLANYVIAGLMRLAVHPRELLRRVRSRIRRNFREPADDSKERGLNAVEKLAAAKVSHE